MVVFRIYGTVIRSTPQCTYVFCKGSWIASTHAVLGQTESDGIGTGTIGRRPRELRRTTETTSPPLSPISRDWWAKLKPAEGECAYVYTRRSSGEASIKRAAEGWVKNESATLSTSPRGQEDESSGYCEPYRTRPWTRYQHETKSPVLSGDPRGGYMSNAA